MPSVSSARTACARKVGQAALGSTRIPAAGRIAEVLAGGQGWAMEKRHAEGFFCAQMTGDPQRYPLRAHLLDGGEAESKTLIVSAS